MVKINPSFYTKILKSSSIQEKAYQELNEEVLSAKEELLQEFDSHKVTQELNDGPSREGSDVLPEGYGNLFAFLGIEKNRKPTEEVRSELEKIKVIRKPLVLSNYWKFRIIVPSSEDIERKTMLKWEPRSWVSAITHGLSGFSSFMFKQGEGSRSGYGVQTSNKIRKGVFNGVSYVFGMLGRFKRRISK
jgi:hypothetical protein